MVNPVGWRYESYRHMLARKGIKTVVGRSGRVGSVRGIPIIMQKVQMGHVYPASPDDVKKVIERFKPEDTKGLKGVEFTSPKDKSERAAWARYVRSKRTVKIFSQPVSKDGKVSKEDPWMLRDHFTSYVLPHEIGHHVALEVRGITDKKLSMAEARADAVTVGMDVEDPNVKLLQPAHKSVDRKYNAEKEDWGEEQEDFADEVRETVENPVEEGMEHGAPFEKKGGIVDKFMVDYRQKGGRHIGDGHIVDAAFKGSFVDRWMQDYRRR